MKLSFNVTLSYLMCWIMELCMASSLALDNWTQKYCQTLGKLISQTIRTTCYCCKDDYFKKRKFKNLIVCFTQCTLFFQQDCCLLHCRFVCRALSEDHMHEIMECYVTSSFALVNWEQKYCHTLDNKPNHSHRVLWRRLFSKGKF